MINGFLRGGDGYYASPEKYPRRFDGFLMANNGPVNDGYLRPLRWAYEAAAAAVAFPTQFAGLRYFLGTVRELCLVALGDAPSGDQWRVQKNGTTYAVYLVDTTDPDASQVRVRTSDGIRAARLKT
jgi:hypothetical protein